MVDTFFTKLRARFTSPFQAGVTAKQAQDAPGAQASIEVASSTLEELPIAKQIWNEKPVYKIRFPTDKAYQDFANALQQRCKGVDIAGKLRFDPIERQIDVHYFPRIAEKVLMPLEKLFPKPADFEPDVLGPRFVSQDSVNQDPFQPIHRFMTCEYAEQHEQAFERRAKQWQQTCLQIDSWKSRPVLCETNCQGSEVDFQKFFEALAQQSFLVGEVHTDRNEFIHHNIEHLARLGFDTLFLEGVPYEAQGLIDAYLASPDEVLPNELEILLGHHAALVTKAKLCGVRTVGIDSQQTYLPRPERYSYVPLREAAFNDMAVEIIRKEQGKGKYVAVVGEAHVLLSPLHKTPGIGAVLEVPAVRIRDAMWLADAPLKCRLVSMDDFIFKTEFGRSLFIDRNRGTTLESWERNSGCDVLVELEVHEKTAWRMG